MPRFLLMPQILRGFRLIPNSGPVPLIVNDGSGADDVAIDPIPIGGIGEELSQKPAGVGEQCGQRIIALIGRIEAEHDVTRGRTNHEHWLGL